MGNRIIKESIRTSKSINTMTDFQFRMWAYLVTYVDDYGRGSADPELLKGFVFPRRKGVTESTIEKTLAELATIGSIHLYKVDGESYLCFPNWSDHQRVQQKRSKFPPPPGKIDEVQNPTVSHGELPPESNPNPNPNPNPIQSESNAWADERPSFDTVEVYATNNLKFMSPTYMAELADFKADFPDDVIRYAIDEACENGGRSWRYAKGVLNKCLEEGHKTLGAIKARDDAYRKAKQAQAEPPKPKYKILE